MSFILQEQKLNNLACNAKEKLKPQPKVIRLNYKDHLLKKAKNLRAKYDTHKPMTATTDLRSQSRDYQEANLRPKTKPKTKTKAQKYLNKTGGKRFIWIIF